MAALTVEEPMARRRRQVQLHEVLNDPPPELRGWVSREEVGRAMVRDWEWR